MKPVIPDYDWSIFGVRVSDIGYFSLDWRCFQGEINDGAKAVVKELAERLGFVSVDAGPLRNSRFLEPTDMMNIQFAYFLGRVQRQPRQD
jgi:hypothetical protein